MRSQQTGVPVGISWNQNLTAADMLVIPKGAKHKDEAMKYLAAATSAQAQANFAADTGYAPINVKSAALMSPADCEDPAGPVQGLADQSRHEVLGRSSRRDRQALVCVAVEISTRARERRIVIGVDGRHHA